MSPSSTCILTACAAASEKLSPTSTTSPPRLRTASTLSAGAVTGITITARQPRRQGHTLRVVARGSANHAASALFGAQMHHLVESAAKFERKHRLRVFALQKHFVADSQRKPFGFIKRRFARHIVYAGREDFAQILLSIQFCLCHAYPCFFVCFYSLLTKRPSIYDCFLLFAAPHHSAFCSKPPLFRNRLLRFLVTLL